jgi:hypothetical protein
MTWAIHSIKVEKARDDYRSGADYNDRCTPNGNDAWCAGFMSGYAIAWNALAASGEERGSN